MQSYGANSSKSRSLSPVVPSHQNSGEDGYRGVNAINHMYLQNQASLSSANTNATTHIDVMQDRPAGSCCFPQALWLAHSCLHRAGAPKQGLN